MTSIIKPMPQKYESPLGIFIRSIKHHVGCVCAIVFQKLNFHSRCCKLIQITSLEGMVSVSIEIIYLKIYSVTQHSSSCGA